MHLERICELLSASKTFLNLSNHPTGWIDRNNFFLEAFKQHFSPLATDINRCLCTILSSRIRLAGAWRLFTFKVAGAHVSS